MRHGTGSPQDVNPKHEVEPPIEGEKAQRGAPSTRGFELIFDLDDTLLDSFGGYSRTHRRVARHLGWPVLSTDELVTYDNDFPSTLRRQYPDREPAPFIEAWARFMNEHPYGPIARVPEALCRLRERGHRLWIVTSRRRENLALRLSQACIDVGWFEGVFTADEQPALKPDPRCFDPVWQCIGKRPGHCDLAPTLYVGDRHGDRLAAHAAGIPFIAVLTGPEVRQGFPGDLDPDFVIPDASAIVDWVESYADRHHSRQSG